MYTCQLTHKHTDTGSTSRASHRSGHILHRRELQRVHREANRPLRRPSYATTQKLSPVERICSVRAFHTHRFLIFFHSEADSPAPGILFSTRFQNHLGRPKAIGSPTLLLLGYRQCLSTAQEERRDGFDDRSYFDL
jgi:hypothetical protein